MARQGDPVIGLDPPMRRVVVVGTSGSGKTTLARALAGRLGVPHIELDALHHQPGWTPMPREEFRAEVAGRLRGDGWVVDGNYAASVQDVVWPRVDAVVWLDLGRPLVMWRIVGRTLRRVIRGEELWNGNRERWRNVLTLDPEESVILWAWTRHRGYRARYLEAMGDPRWTHLRFVRLRHRRDVRRLLAAL